MSIARPFAGRAWRRCAASGMTVLCIAGAVGSTPQAHADNKRLNDGVFADVYVIHDRAKCPHAVKIDPRLRLAAQGHAVDVLNNRNLDGDVGSDGSVPQDRANAAGFHGRVTETVAINPAVAISGIELINRWYSNPDYLAIMSDCANTAMGVWSENSPDRTVVVAVYGQPTEADGNGVSSPQGGGIDPTPDYDGSDEVLYGVSWFAWILRGAYPPPAYPPG